VNILFHKNYNELFGLDNIFSAWQKFRRGKSGKIEIMIFERHLEENIFDLHLELKNKTYKHDGYTSFIKYDSKKRNIDNAEIRDKIVHQIVFDYLNDLFEPTFINDSYSSIINKGTHKAVKTFRYFSKLKRAKNENVFILKCDIKKYFDSINHDVLFNLIKKRVKNKLILSVVKEIIESFHFDDATNKGIPLGNITSQIFLNIYLNNFDHFVKKRLKARFYVRYNDDFILINNDKYKLEFCLKEIRKFLANFLLETPENKTSIRKLKWGVDFLGFTILPNCILLRDETKQKVFERMNENNFQSYFALLKHCNSHGLKNKITSKLNDFFDYI